MPNPDSSSNQVEIPVTDVEITVTFTPVGDNVDSSVESNANNDAASKSVTERSAPIVIMAQRQEFLSDFYYEADPTLPHEGDWQITVAVTGEEGSGSTEFMMETLPARTINWMFVAGAGVVLLVLLALIAIWSRAQQTAQPARRPQRSARHVQRPSSTAQARKEA
jgi:hypothetical protein